MVIKCDMCNANIIVEEGERLATCQFCGAVNMLPELPGENSAKRGYLYLEEGNWEAAKEQFNKALDENAECSDAYLGKVLVATKVKSKQEFFDMENVENLEEILRNIKYYPHYKNAIRFANGKKQSNLEKFRENVYNMVYDKAKSHIEAKDYYSAMGWLKWIEEYKDSAELIVECDKAARCGVEADMYKEALGYMDKKAYKNAEALFEKLKDYEESKQLALECKYKYAKEKMKAEDYVDAIKLFKEIAEYDDVPDLIKRCEDIVTERRYSYAMGVFDSAVTTEDVSRAKEVFEKLADYKDSRDMLLKCDEKTADIIKEDLKRAKSRRIRNKVQGVMLGLLVAVFWAVVLALLNIKFK